MPLYALTNQFATVEEFFQFTTGQSVIPDDLDRNLADANLKRASMIVTRRVRLGRYRIDPDGFPNSPIVRAAFRDATCAQLTFWGGNDADGEEITGKSANWNTVTMAGVTLSRRIRSATETPESARIAPEALEYLMASGIFSTRVSTSPLFPVVYP